MTRRVARLAVALLGGVIAACGLREPLEFDLETMGDPRSEAFAEFVESHRAALDAPALGLAIVRDDAVMWADGFGWADYEADRDADADTPFMVASVSKTIVAVAVMQQVEQGTLDLDEPIAPHLSFTVEHPEHRGTAITLRMLLVHTSGIADDDDLLYALRSLEAQADLDLEALLRDYLDPDGRYYSAGKNFHDDEPGARHDYTNIGMALAALVVERSTGRPFHAYAREQVFAPLGMDRTSFRVDEAVAAGAAMPYQREELGWLPYGHYGVVPYPSSSLHASPADLARFLAAIDGGGELDGERVLAPETVEEMLDLAYTRGSTRRTLGWTILERSSGDVVGHRGDLAGVTADMWMRRTGDAGAIVMCSLGREDGDFVRSIRGLEDALLAIAEAP